MKREYLFLGLPFLLYGLFLATLYTNINISSVFFMLCVLSTIISTIVLFNREQGVVNNA